MVRLGSRIGGWGGPLFLRAVYGFQIVKASSHSGKPVDAEFFGSSTSDPAEFKQNVSLFVSEFHQALAAKESNATTPGGPSKKPAILVVDDFAGMRNDFVVTLRKRFGDLFNYVTAVNGVDASQRINSLEGPLAMVITDLQMPEMNGLKLTQHLTAQYPQLSILLHSGDRPEEIESYQREFLGNPYVRVLNKKEFDREGMKFVADALAGKLQEPTDLPALVLTGSTAFGWHHYILLSFFVFLIVHGKGSPVRGLNRLNAQIGSITQRFWTHFQLHFRQHRDLISRSLTFQAA